MIDLGFQTILSNTNVILTALEERVNRIDWTVSDNINAMRKQHTLNFASANSQCGAAREMYFVGRSCV